MQYQHLKSTVHKYGVVASPPAERWLDAYKSQMGDAMMLSFL